jgi:hypothetical protein
MAVNHIMCSFLYGHEKFILILKFPALFEDSSCGFSIDEP